MKKHTNDFKSQIKEFGRELSSKITFTINGTTTELENEDLNAITPHYESSLLKSVMKQLDVDSNVYIPEGTEINYQFGLLVNNAYEYVDYGNYIVYSVEKQEDTKSWKIICYDKMLYAMKDYKKIVGKNLFLLPEASSQNQVSYTINDDGTINLSGTASANTTIYIFKDLSEANIVDGASYNFSATKSIPSGVEIRCEAYNESTWQRHVIDGVLNSNTSSRTGTANLTNTTRIKYTIYIANGTNSTVSNLGIQFEKGSTTSSFVPYFKYPVRIKDYLYNICYELGLNFASYLDNFVNSDKTILNELYLDADGNNLDYTYRDVLDEIAQATASVICINEKDELEIRYVNEQGTYETLSGTTIAINNSDSENIKLELKGDTQQTSTPTPTTPIEVQTITGRQDIEVCGKNLTNFTTINYTQANSATVTRTDGTYTVSNSTNQYGSVRFEQSNLRLEPNTTYTFSAKILSTNTSDGSSVYITGTMDVNATNTYGNKASTGGISYVTFTTPNTISNSAYLALYPREANKETVFTDIMVEKGNQATTYEAYNGNTYEINLGKNVLQLTNGTYSHNGVEAVVEDGKITLNGTATANSFITIPTNINNIYKTLVGNYTLCSNNEQIVGSATTSGTYADVRIMGNGGVDFIWRNILGNKNASQTATPSAYTNISFLIRTGSGLTYNDFIIYPQLEKGDTASSFAPYKAPIELCKIGNYQDFIRKGTGKNIFDINQKYTTNRVSVSINNNVLALVNTGTYSRIMWDIKSFEVGQKYTFSVSFSNRNACSLRINLMDKTNTTTIASSDTLTSQTGSLSITFTATDTEHYIRLYSNTLSSSSSNTVYFYDIQLEKSSSKTEYEPYAFNNKWYLYKLFNKITLTGEETGWALYTSGTRRFGLSLTDTAIFPLPISTNYGTGYSNYFPVSQGTSTNLNMFYQYGTTSYIGVVDTGSTWASTQAFKNWLNGVSVHCYYVLNTPIVSEITDVSFIIQLENIKLLDGSNNVSVSSNNLSSPISITYLKLMDTINEEYLKDVNVNFGEQYGPINSVVLSRSAESDNIYRNDETSIGENGLTEIKIKDNQILNGNNRDMFIDEIFNKLNGLKYCINDYTSTGIVYLDLLDMYKVSVENNSYKCIMLNDEVDITQGLQEVIHSDKAEDSETDYTKADKTDRKINQAYIIVDKQNQEINSVVQNINTLQTVVNSQGQQIDALGTRITQTAENITASVSSIQSELDNGVSLVKTTSVIINNEGLTVATDTSKTTTTMTSDKFAVKSGGKDLAFFGYDEDTSSTKAEMDNLTVSNFLITGCHRIQKMPNEQRTGVFFIGG